MLILTAMEVFYSFAVLLLACELGQRFNLAFDECSTTVEQLEWYSFPLDVQRLLPLILNFTQQPIEIKCFGSVACDREAFKYVRINPKISQHNLKIDEKFRINTFQIIKTAFSYFTILRQFY